MKVILLKDVAKVGKRYDLKEVADGFGRNFLIGRGLALAATPDALQKLASWKSGQEADLKVKNDLLTKALADLKNQTLTITVKANDEGHLFAGLRADDLVKAVKEVSKIELDPTWIVLDKPIKLTGQHAITIKAGDLSGLLNLVINKK